MVKASNRRCEIKPKKTFYSSTPANRWFDIIVISDDVSQMRYPGGKFRCYQKLINLMPPHRVYIETHLGGGAVLRNKAPADLSFGIDRSPAVIQTFNGHFDGRFSFIIGTAEQFLESYSFKGGELIYADPPYWPPSRRSPRSPYHHRYTEAEHVSLLRLLKGLPCNIMISGYANSTYSQELRGWHTHVFMGTTHRGLREETVWMNFRPGVLHDTQYLGDTFRDRQAIKRKRVRWLMRFSNEPFGIQQAILNDLEGIFIRQTKQKNLQR